MSDHPILEVHDVTRRYADRIAVEAASLQLEPGQVSCLLGPSGCGKSTILRMIAGLEPVDDGEIRCHDRVMSQPGLTVRPEDRGIGLVFQDNALFPHLDVKANIGFGLKGLPAEERRRRIAALLARFHIEHLADAWPHMLSGGEQQRVAIARALAREPALLLLDEPFSGLDGQLRETIRTSLLSDLRDLGTSVLIVTHDPEEAMMVADRLILMSGGRILQSGSPLSCYSQPASEIAARLLGHVIVVPALIADGMANTPLGAVPLPSAPDGPAEILLRPEALTIGAAGTKATVSAVRFAGNGYAVDLDAGSLALTIRHQGQPPLPGCEVCVTMSADMATNFVVKRN